MAGFGEVSNHKLFMFRPTAQMSAHKRAPLPEQLSATPLIVQLVLVVGDFHIPHRAADINEQFRKILVSDSDAFMNNMPATMA
jgi:hypothetical protein